MPWPSPPPQARLFGYASEMYTYLSALLYGSTALGLQGAIRQAGRGQGGACCCMWAAAAQCRPLLGRRVRWR